MPHPRSLVLLTLLLSLTNCRTLPVTSTEYWTRTELYFGLKKPGGQIISESEWRAFLNDTVTPLFPDGLTIMQAEGRYRSRTDGLIEEPTRVLVILHQRADAKIDHLTRRYIQLFNQESILRSDAPASVTFITPTQQSPGVPTRLSK